MENNNIHVVGARENFKFGRLKHTAVYNFLIITLLILSGCSLNGQANKSNNDNATIVLKDIAYDAGKSFDNRVYLNENGEYIPYLVLTSDYEGNCLLLRENLLDEKRIYNNPGRQASYYGESDIDRFLNEEFIQSYSDELRKYIVESNIEIAAKESIGPAGIETTKINRKIFLLSYTELDGTPSRTILEEGTPLLYFSNKDNRIATYKNGTQGGWWLRSASTFGTAYACAVSKDGLMGSTGIYNPNGGYFNGVRPALCLPGNMILSHNELGYILELDN